MNITILGAGKIGTVIGRLMTESGHDVLFVDPRAGLAAQPPVRARSLDGLTRREIAATAVWIVAAPTEEHLPLLQGILSRAPRARILVEKPLCSYGEIARARSLLASYPEARVMIDDTYAWSPVIRRLAEKIASAGPIAKVSVEFSKNRRRDESLERFRDTQLLHFGYEWFHLISTLRVLLPRGGYREYLRRPARESLVSRNEERAALPRSGVEVRLFSDMAGRIGMPALLGARLYKGREAKSVLSRGEIPFDSDFRYRVVEATFRDGSVAGAVFESGGKNEHSLYTAPAGGALSVERWKGNHFGEALAAQLLRLRIASRAELDGLLELQLAQQRRLEDLVLFRDGIAAGTAEPLSRFKVDEHKGELARSRRGGLTRSWNRFVSACEGAPVPPPGEGWVRRVLARHPVYAPMRAAGGPRTLSKAALRRQEDPFRVRAYEGEIAWAAKTSGTTGKPLEVRYSTAFHLANFFLVHLKAAKVAGIETVGRREVLSVFLTDNAAYEPTIYPGSAAGRGANVVLPLRSTDDASLKRARLWIERFNPEILSTKPSLLRVLLQSRSGTTLPFKPSFKMIVTSGAALDESLRRDAEEAFRCPVVSSYNTTELSHIASECPRRSFHIDTTLHHAEVLRPDGSIGTDGAGRLLITCTANRWFPLVRYEVGDDAVLREDGCACGRGGPYLASLKGRTVPVFKLFNGDFIVPSRWMKIFERVPGLREFSVRQKSPRRFHVSGDFGPGAAGPRSRRLRNLASAFRAGLPPEVVFTAGEAELAGKEKLVRFLSEVEHD